MRNPSNQSAHGGCVDGGGIGHALQHGAKRGLQSSRIAPVQVLARASDMLRLLKTSAFGLTQTEIAAQLRLPRTTVNRIVRALRAESFVEIVGSSERIRLGREMLAMSHAMTSGCGIEIRQILLSLAEEVGETVDFALFDRGQAILVEEVTVLHRLSATGTVSIDFPLHNTAIGKAMLAAMTPDDYARVVPMNLSPATRNTITSHAKLHEEMVKIRKAGVAYDREENSIGICAIGIGISSSSFRLSAIAIPIPVQRFAEKRAAAVVALTAAAARIESIWCDVL